MFSWKRWVNETLVENAAIDHFSISHICLSSVLINSNVVIRYWITDWLANVHSYTTF